MNIKFLNNNIIKLIAILSMVADHLFKSGIITNSFFEIFGRIAFPLFAFLVSEGYYKTSNKNKYILNMFIFAFISEIPYDLLFFNKIDIQQQNVLFTFLFSLLSLKILDYLKTLDKNSSILYSCVFLFSVFIITTILRVDYLGFGVILVILFYYERNKNIKWMSIIYLFIFSLIFSYQNSIILYEKELPLQFFCLPSLVIIFMYNGERGRKNNLFKYFFYIFYPVHLAFIYYISLFY